MNWATMSWFQRWEFMGKPGIVIVSDKNSEIVLFTRDYDEYQKARILLEKVGAEFQTFIEFN